MLSSIAVVEKKVSRCRKCQRLVTWRQKVAQEKRRAYRHDTYWGKAVPGFGDPNARILVVGLAPGAHGANRTGRMFTGDRSGDWLYRAMYKAGLANQPKSVGRSDGLKLKGAYVTSVVKCAPPKNRPTIDERNQCLPFIESEFLQLKDVKVVVALGNFGWSGTLLALKALGHRRTPQPKFGHGAEVKVGPYWLFGVYHPSQQNTFTRRLTEEMLEKVFMRARNRAFIKS